ncbi:MAG: reverse transcriptase domain-containing protein [Minicystis sp.]
MRTVSAGTFERLSSVAGLWQAFQRCRANKRRTPSIAAFDADADRLIFALHRDLVSGSYVPGPFSLRVVEEPKRRLIAAAPVRDRVVHQALVRAIAAPFEARFVDQSYAGIEGRGAHRALLRHLVDHRRFAFRVHLDIRRYFPSIHLPSLRALIGARVADQRTLGLLDQLMRRGAGVYTHPLAFEVLGLAAAPLPVDCGVPVGTYLSQWCGNVFLDGLDHFIKRELRIRGYVRYMDDFVLFHDDEGVLRAAKESVAQWLQENRRLELSPKRGRLLGRDQPSTFLGYRVSRAGLGPSRKLRSRMAESLRAAGEKGPLALERCVRAYRGLLTFG